MLRVCKKPLAHFIVSRQVRPGRLARFRFVTLGAARYEIAFRRITAANPRLHVIQRQLIRAKLFAAVHTAERIATKYSLAPAFHASDAGRESHESWYTRWRALLRPS